jgi:urease accessory protein
MNPSTEPLGRLRLMQLVSPALPVGAFTYSQGLEWAVAEGWVKDPATLKSWLGGLMEDGIGRLELPVLQRLYQAAIGGDEQKLREWAQWLYASRETRELRAEETNRARALARLLIALGVDQAAVWRQSISRCQAAPFALAAVHWGISLEDCLLGYAWGWLENQTAAAIKLIPLGQTAGQRLQFELGARLPEVLTKAIDLPDDQIGAAAPALAIASSRHEIQYTRLFRS